MSDQTTIFNQNPPTQAQTPPTNQGGTGNDQLANLLAAIKNPDGQPKYKSVEDALNALKHAQEFIPTLQSQVAQRETELAAARAEAARIAELERTLQALTEQKNTPETPVSAVSESRIAEIVAQTLTRTQQETLAVQNQQAVVAEMTKSFGEKASEVYAAKAAENGMSVAEFNALAAKNPKVVLKLVGAEQAPKPSVAPNTTSVNTAGFQPTADSFIRRNDKSLAYGMTTQDLNQESANARKMVEELHSQGLSVNDLTKPSVYFKMFQGNN